MNKHISLIEDLIQYLTEEKNSGVAVPTAQEYNKYINSLTWVVNKAKLIKQMDEALAFYADISNHEYYQDAFDYVSESPVTKDAGDMARKARGDID